MAELEVVKHAKKAYRALNQPNTSWLHRLKEIAVEIFIIVFAISLTLYLEHLFEARHQRQMEKDFLIGLKKDLESDIKELSEDSIAYAFKQKAFTYFRQAGMNQALSKDSINNYYNALTNTIQLIPNNSRFEGLKGSGHLDVIQNKELLNNILELYQEQIPILLSGTRPFLEFQYNRLIPYLAENVVLEKNEILEEKIFTKPIFQNYLSHYNYVSSIIGRYHQVLDQCRLIILQIDEEYN